MDSLRETTTSVVIKYVDLDNNLVELASSPSVIAVIGQPIAYSTAGKIKELEQQGYVLVNNAFDPSGTAPIFDDSEASYMVTFKHGRELVTHDHLKYGCTLKDLQVKGMQIVHYNGADNRTPRDMVSTVTFNRVLVFDKVTGKEIGSQGWSEDEKTFPVIGTPNVLGYEPDQAYVGGDTITPDKPNREYTVTYKIDSTEPSSVQTARIKYLDLDNHNAEIAISDELVGAPNTPISYHTAKTISNLKAKGYIVVDNEFDKNGSIQFFDNSDKFTQTFIVTLKHDHLLVDSKHPNTGVDSSLYLRTVTRTIKYIGAEEKTPQPLIQKVTWNRTLLVDAVSGKVIEDSNSSTDWSATQDTFEQIKVPIIKGYHADQAMIAAAPVTFDNQIEEVKYTANGYVIPVDKNSQLISNINKIQYVTDENDPTKVVTPITLPVIRDYEPVEKQLTINDPTQDTKARYYLAHKYVPFDKDHPISGVNPGYYERSVTAIVHYQGAGDKTPEDSVQVASWNRTATYDEISKKIVENGKYDSVWTVDKQKFKQVQTPMIDGYIADMSSVSAHDVTKSDLMATITYQPVGHIVPIDEAGKPLSGIEPTPYIVDPYDVTRVLITEDVPTIEGYVTDQKAITVRNPLQDTEVVYKLKPHYIKVNSDHPYQGIDPSIYSLKTRAVVRYVGAGTQTPPERIQTAYWHRDITVNKNNGNIIEDGKFDSEWSVDKTTYANVPTPAIDGYHADKAQVDSFKVDLKNHETQIFYQKNGHIVPVNNDGIKLSHVLTPSYITDPTDSTKVLGEQPVPRLMNYVPTQSLVKVENPETDVKVVYYPFEQVERIGTDTSKNANIAVRESEPEEGNNSSNILFIPVNHKVGKAIVNFVDLENNAYPIATSDILVGDAGTKINDIYTTATEIKKLNKQGYEVVYNGFDGNNAVQYFEYDQKGIKVYTVAMKHIDISGHDKDLTLKNVGIETNNNVKGESVLSESVSTEKEKPTVILPTLDKKSLEQDKKEDKPKKNALKGFFHWNKNR